MLSWYINFVDSPTFDKSMFEKQIFLISKAAQILPYVAQLNLPEYLFFFQKYLYFRHKLIWVKI